MKLKSHHKIAIAFALLASILFAILFFYLDHVSPGKMAGHQADLVGLAMALIFAMAILVNYVSAALLTKPLARIVQAVQNIAKGHFNQISIREERDEVLELAQAIDFMQQQFRRRMDEVLCDRSRLEAVLLSMFEGVMVVGAERKIILMNQVLKQILHVEHEVQGRKTIEVIRQIEVQEIIEAVLKNPRKIQAREMSFYLPEEKILRIHAAAVLRDGKSDGVVLVFHDITDLRRLEAFRKDFVANVSHELRTPIANIKGYSETLLEGAWDDPAHAREFLEIIYNESDRLAKLVDDLLDLARLESGKPALNLKPCQVQDLCERAIAGLTRFTQEKNVSLENLIPLDLPIVSVDEIAIMQVLQNLIENAIKYNRPSGKVIVKALKTAGAIEVCIQDTGIGIPKDDLPRIFERFYRVDKARSRELGGTGLGLSIVKHIIQAHGGEVFVESIFGTGTTFRFTLPININSRSL